MTQMVADKEIAMASYGATGGGLANAFGSFAADGAGLHPAFGSFVSAAAGLHDAFGSFAANGAGLAAVLLPCGAQIAGLHRAANDALDRYELYRGADADPDFLAAPWETFTSLPHESAALDPNHAYRFVLRRRSRWNLASQNVRAWELRIAADGSAEAVLPAGPDWAILEAAAGGTMRVRAAYAYARDGAYQAASWLVYLTSDGLDPDPEVDEPTVVEMQKRDGTARLDWTSEAFGDGAAIKVLVRTRRVDSGPVNVNSENMEIETAEANTDGPDAPDPLKTWFGTLREQI